MEVKRKNRLYLYYVLHDLHYFHAFLIILAAVLYGASKITREELFSDLGYWLFFLTILSFFIHWNQQKLYQYMCINDKVAYLPAKQILMLNRFFMLLYLLISGISMWIFSHLPYQKITSALAAFFRSTVGSLMKLFLHDTPQTANDPGAVIEWNPGYLGADAVSDNNPVLNMILHIIETGLEIFAFLLLFILLVRWISRVYQSLLRRSSHTLPDLHEFVSVRESRTDIRKTRKTVLSRLFTGNDTNILIRKYYYKTIKRYLKQHYKKEKSIPFQHLCSLTPEEIEHYAKIPDGTALSELHTAYEKARYSNINCTSSEYRKLKNHEY